MATIKRDHQVRGVRSWRSSLWGSRSTSYRVVVITGASAGVGRATAHAFARRGASIGLLARDADELEEVASEVRALGGEALPLAVDVADAGQLEDAAARVEQKFGPIDVWVNNAMATIFSPFMKVTPEEFRRVTDVTYHGYVWGTQAALRRMLERDRGVIIQVGSALAYRSIPLQSAYCGAKAAIRAFTDALRSELIHDHSRVHLTMVQLPAINTPQFNWARANMSRMPRPVAPVFEPELAARAIEWSARHRRRELVLGTSSLQAIWGQKLIPGLLDRYLARVAYEGQRDDQPLPAGHEDNLWEPVHDRHATRGRFGNESERGALQLHLSTHRRWLAGGALAAGLLSWWLCRGKRRRPTHR